MEFTPQMELPDRRFIPASLKACTFGMIAAAALGLTASSHPQEKQVLSEVSIMELPNCRLTETDCGREVEQDSVAVVQFGGLNDGQEYDPSTVVDIVKHGMELMTRGAIEFAPVLYEASNLAVATVVDTYPAGHGQPVCFYDLGRKPLMAEIAQQTMPEIANYDIVLAIGGQDCDQYEKGAANPNKGLADVYTNQSNGIISSDEDINHRIANTTSHEYMHIRGLDHAGYVECINADDNETLAKHVALEAYMNASCVYNDTGDWGNLMSELSRPQDMSRGDILTVLQQDHLGLKELSADIAAFKPFFGQYHATLEGDINQPGPKYASLPMPTHLGPTIHPDLQEFTEINFIPILNDSGTTVERVQVVLGKWIDSRYGSLYQTAEIASLLVDNKPRVLTLGDLKATFSANRTALSFDFDNISH